MKTYDEFLLDQDPDWHRHPNGGGLIYKNAYVDETAFVSEHAKVLSGRVLGNARIEDSACVYNDAVVKDNARVYGGAWIFDNAIIAGNAEVFDNAHVAGYARIFGNAKISGDNIHYDNEISD